MPYICWLLNFHLEVEPYTPERFAWLRTQYQGVEVRYF